MINSLINFPVNLTIFKNNYSNLVSIFSVKHFTEHQFKTCNLDRFGNDLVYLALPCPLDVLFFDVASAGHDHWLGYFVQSVKISDLFSRFETVHYWDTNVCQDKPIDMRARGQTVFDFVERLQTIVSSIDIAKKALYF